MGYQGGDDRYKLWLEMYMYMYHPDEGVSLNSSVIHSPFGVSKTFSKTVLSLLPPELLSVNLELPQRPRRRREDLSHPIVMNQLRHVQEVNRVSFLLLTLFVISPPPFILSPSPLSLSLSLSLTPFLTLSNLSIPLFCSVQVLHTS